VQALKASQHNNHHHKGEDQDGHLVTHGHAKPCFTCCRALSGAAVEQLLDQICTKQKPESQGRKPMKLL
jgi:hypothetical protein